MSQKVVDRLEKIDANGDGRISADELVGAIEKLIDEEKKHRDYKCIACGVIALLLFVLLANLGLAFGTLRPAFVYLSRYHIIETQKHTRAILHDFIPRR
jgi:hypothetical protein